MPEFLVLPEKARLAAAQQLPHPQQMAQAQQLWKLSASGVPQSLYVPGRYYCLSRSKHVICIVTYASNKLHAVIVLKEDT